MIDVKVCSTRKRTSVCQIFQPVTIGEDVVDDDDAMVLLDADGGGRNLFNEFDGDKVGLSSAMVGNGEIVDRRYSNCS